MNGFKLTIIGAGSPYTPELLEEIKKYENKLPVREIMLYDIDEKRLEIMTAFCRRFSGNLKLSAAIGSTTCLKEALEGADFVDTQIRVGGNKQRIKDERIPLKYGLVGQETTGAGGMMKAFRTIPVMLEIAHTMEEVAPDAWIVNYTNPTGLVTEAVTKYSNVKIAGFCSGGIFPKAWVGNALGVDREKVHYDFVGLNHMNFASNVTVDGRPLTDEEFAKVAKECGPDPELVKLLGVLPSPYLQWYFHTQNRVDAILAKGKVRGEEVLEIEKEIYEAFADESSCTKPEALARRGGGGYSEVAIGFIDSVYNNIDKKMVINVPNRGTVSFLPDDAVIETGCLVNRSGIQPLHVSKVPQMCWGLIAAVKNYEQLAVEAAVEGNVRKMKLALLAHPLVRQYELVEKLVPELLEGSRDYLPQFFK